MWFSRRYLEALVDDCDQAASIETVYRAQPAWGAFSLIADGTIGAHQLYFLPERRQPVEAFL